MTLPGLKTMLFELEQGSRKNRTNRYTLIIRSQTVLKLKLPL